ncbi:MutS family DNA mismatch repair protein [Clostridium frigoriphilum]|uniref:MutS family DNA mismatch repair protein n=1 Tax=Clostridium frigoriphilum TaxID=443253 RepID=A0ABU7UTY6_9CLOT|nr:hypothetical protein [Clostridium sp. DSM 17811]
MTEIGGQTLVSAYNNYVNKLRTYKDLIEEQNKSIKSLVYFRFFTFVIDFSVTVYTFIIKSYLVSISVFIVSLVIFIYLIIEKSKAINKRNYSICDFIVKANGLGHPLLGYKKICNNITISNEKNILLITGSNMSGKSTFLRTIGINLVLSYIGATVCAEKFECSLMKIITCMRISDDLENNISSFYAEILRIKMIVEEKRKNKKVFFLLDELFKGTNSIDRHDGAKALIKQLGEQGASGLISTHDLELCDLQYEYFKIKNYNFQEYYVNNEIKFDYKIRDGVSTTKNALYLIKLSGIDLE